jgi:hypothetical protein
LVVKSYEKKLGKSRHRWEDRKYLYKTGGKAVKWTELIQYGVYGEFPGFITMNFSTSNTKLNDTEQGP